MQHFSDSSQPTQQRSLTGHNIIKHGIVMVATDGPICQYICALKKQYLYIDFNKATRHITLGLHFCAWNILWAFPKNIFVIGIGWSFKALWKGRGHWCQTNPLHCPCLPDFTFQHFSPVVTSSVICIKFKHKYTNKQSLSIRVCAPIAICSVEISKQKVVATHTCRVKSTRSHLLTYIPHPS